jgi:phosphate/sulfate permease
METLFLVVVVLLLCLAVFDLVVGVSNDAVNFLSSAVGSRASSMRTILIIASIGVVIGSLVSGGMMGLAKNGMFDPTKLHFQNIMFIYVVVMLTDVFLLDLFNTFRLPTSTTVSIVFELLGASLAISFMETMAKGAGLADWMSFINSAKAFQVIIAIFSSIALAFTAGWLVQYVMRTIVTFDYRRFMRIGGSIFGAISMVVVMNFIFTKGLKYSPLHDEAFFVFIREEALMVFSALGAVTFVVFFWLGRRENFDVFKVITLFGTFALAMAFASNDLVNFIGVPVASLEAFSLWSGSGADPTTMMMDAFAPSVKGDPANMIFLLVAGLIMVSTLFFSKKAQNVVSTTIHLSKQSQGLERFKGNKVSRAIVGFVMKVAGGLTLIIPQSGRDAIGRRYRTKAPKNGNGGQPVAFDFVRASVNLVVAAVVISIGTTLKLPLSTTYVTFMVVMGSSLADRAWNRDSAVYRVSGVFAVVGGWFFTALSALTITFIFAVIVHSLEFIGIGIVVVLVGLGIYLVNRYSNHEADDDAVDLGLPENWSAMEPDDVKSLLHERVRHISADYAATVDRIIGAVIQADGRAITEISKRMEREARRNGQSQALLADQFRTLEVQNIASGKAILDFYVRRRELIKEMQAAIDAAETHILNLHQPLDDQQAATLRRFVELVKEYDQALQPNGKDRIPELEDRLEALNEHSDLAVTYQVEALSRDEHGSSNSQLFLAMFVGHLNAATVIHRMHKKTFVKKKEEKA